MVTDVAALPALIVSMPLVDNVPDPLIVLLPLTPRVMPPLAVIPPPRLKMPPLEVRFKLPLPMDTEVVVSMAPLASTVKELGVPDRFPNVIVVPP